VRRAIKILIHVNQSAAEICVYISVMSVCWFSLYWYLTLSLFLQKLCC
jgi:hypothetical protein